MHYVIAFRVDGVEMTEEWKIGFLEDSTRFMTKTHDGCDVDQEPYEEDEDEELEFPMGGQRFLQ